MDELRYPSDEEWANYFKKGIRPRRVVYSYAYLLWDVLEDGQGGYHYGWFLENKNEM